MNDMDTWSRHYKDVYEKQDNPKGEAHGWIQWKGTQVCIDLYCKCGYPGHVDTEFFYHYECPKCNQKYAVGQNVKLIPLNEEQVKYVTSRNKDTFQTCDLEDE